MSIVTGGFSARGECLAGGLTQIEEQFGMGENEGQ